MTTAAAPRVSTDDVLDAAHTIYIEQAHALDAARGEIAVLRAMLGIESADGLMSLQRIRALENASDAARTYLLGGPVTRQEALEACELARRTL